MQGISAVLVCTDEGDGARDNIAQVVLRKMPRWGVHAGLTVIDLCLAPRPLQQTFTDTALHLDYGLSSKIPTVTRPGACERRYCTDEKQQFSLFINSIPIPMGWTTVSFWLGYQSHSFSIHCDEVLEPTHEWVEGVDEAEKAD